MSPAARKSASSGRIHSGISSVASMNSGTDASYLCVNSSGSTVGPNSHAHAPPGTGSTPASAPRRPRPSSAARIVGVLRLAELHHHDVGDRREHDVDHRHVERGDREQREGRRVEARRHRVLREVALRDVQVAGAGERQRVGELLLEERAVRGARRHDRVRPATHERDHAQRRVSAAAQNSRPVRRTWRRGSSAAARTPSVMT